MKVSVLNNKWAKLPASQKIDRALPGCQPRLKSKTKKTEKIYPELIAKSE
jgi:hypothetical protein